MGDSAITETFGIGGAAMIAAPGVTRFVGGVAWKRPERYLKRWRKLLERNMQCRSQAGIFRARAWTGHCRVVETGITPLINTVSPIKSGDRADWRRHCAGTAGVFEQALEALAESMGLVEERAMTIIHPLLPAVVHRIIASPGG
ncbi:protein, C-ter fragment, truncated protein [Escherichia coli]|uniref:Protein, C-ter, truncated protein n=1 Tax=Escherichia coli TaxID=562 RepID=A0A376TJP7_ECOLX|nr:protein, C-ter fragment, truncated protein [Escherichia coli]